MNDPIFDAEKSHLDETLFKVKDAKEMVGNTIKSLGTSNLDRLVELRENPEKGLDFEYFIEQLHEKNQTLNIRAKFRQIEELNYLITEPYFARIDLTNPESGALQEIYIGKFGYSEERPIITDWRAKVASVFYKYRYPQKNVFYDTPLGIEKRDLTLKRTFEIDDGTLIKYYNNDIQFDERDIVIKKISDRTGGVLEDIVETIQKDQMEIIEADPRQLSIVQGCVGSGKSTVAIHKLSHIFFNFPQFIHSDRSILIAKNQILVGYLSTLFPKLGIFDLNYKTLRDLLVNAIFREEISVKFDMSVGQDTGNFTIKDVQKFNSAVDSVHESVKSALNILFSDPIYESFGHYKYSALQTPYENIKEILEDLNEELDTQTELVKENPKSIKALFYRDNIKNLRKLIRALDKIRLDIRNDYFRKLLKKYSISADKELDYSQCLIYLNIYARLIGFTKFLPYEYCVVDEGQDFSLLEYMILGKLVTHGRISIFGDLNQAIEGDGIKSWEELNEVITEAKNAQVFTLDTNYRSTEQIISFANKILGGFTKKYLPKSINRTGPEPEDIVFETNEELFTKLNESIKHDLTNNNRTVGIISYLPDLLNELYKNLVKSGFPSENLHILEPSQQLVYKPNGIYLMDIDNCKGLEFASVYVINLELDRVANALDAKKAFVAVTRAMNKLSLYGIKKEN
ncbi:ATP-binding domain-containing protein [candidate division WWE3 bacterium]|uniref:ATP-binding domain-containing protein n=1 Tax=candidate division WWE3 bacterium TaxID=2053526 RepID=A0A7X9DKZ0_UNCKA|nr:ATP-binding domain-containing protein [candidate division WWE3 bacterium]